MGTNHSDISKYICTSISSVRKRVVFCDKNQYLSHLNIPKTFDLIYLNIQNHWCQLGDHYAERFLTDEQELIEEPTTTAKTQRKKGAEESKSEAEAKGSDDSDGPSESGASDDSSDGDDSPDDVVLGDSDDEDGADMEFVPAGIEDRHADPGGDSDDGLGSSDADMIGNRNPGVSCFVINQ